MWRFQGVVGLFAAFHARVGNYFRPYLSIPASAIEAQHSNENCSTIFIDIIALIRDDVTKISRNVKPRLGGDRFAWFVDVLGKIFRCSCFSLFVRNASMVYCLRLYKLFRHGNQKVLASLTAGEQRTAFQMACKNSTNEHAS